MSPDSETSVERAPEIDELKHFITPFLAAFPNPIVVRAGGAASGGQASGTSVLSWSLRGARRADLYAYPPDGTAQFLGTKTTDGWVRSGPVMLGQTYSWKIFPFRNKTTPYDEEHVTARELDLPAGAGPLGQPHKSENVFYPTNLVSRAAWYAREHSSFVAGPGGLFTSGLGADVDRMPTPDEVVVGYIHRHESVGWFGASYAQYDTFWRGGVQFDAAALQSYVQRWGMAAATLRFRVSRSESSFLARIEQAAQDMTDWEPFAAGALPSDGTHGVDLPVGALPLGQASSYSIGGDGVIVADVRVIADRWSLFSSLPSAFALIGPDENFVQDDTSTCVTHYSDFVLEITPSPFR